MLPIAIPVASAFLAAGGLIFNMRNTRKQRERSEEEQPRKVYVGVKQSPTAPTKSTVYIHNGSDYPIYKIRVQWRERNPEGFQFHHTRRPALEPGRGAEVDDVEYDPRSDILAAFDDYKGNRWVINDRGRFERQGKRVTSTMDYDAYFRKPQSE